MTGTLLNVATVLLGGLLGTTLGARLPERIRETVLHGLGLVTLTVGVHLTLQTKNILIVMGSILTGATLGEWWRIEKRLHSVGAWLEARVQGNGPRRTTTFIQGFVTASLVFCVGPMAILGALQDGLSGDFRLLAIKSLLDGFAALAFASSLGSCLMILSMLLSTYRAAVWVINKASTEYA